MTLHLYFARKFLFSLIAVFGAFFTLNVMIDMVEHLRRFDSDVVGFGEALGLALLNAPTNLYHITPLIVVLATIALFLSLARTSELVVTRASGRSALRSVAAPALTAFMLGATLVGVLNPIVAATAQEYDRLATRYARGVESVLSISREGLWLRQGNALGQTVIHAASANLDGTRLNAVTFFAFDRDGRALFRIEAESAELIKGAWRVGAGKRWDFATPGRNPEAEAETFASFRLPSDLTREQIRDSFGSPAAISVWDLPRFIGQLEQAGFSAMQHRVYFQMELAKPLLLAAMVLVAAGFTMRHTRFGRTGLMVLLALMAGVTVFFLRNFAQVLGENGEIPVQVAAWSPPLAAICLSLGLMLHLEDG
ncbi:LPS export ABC transporter permease LptG [Maritimibacter sp. 55A14]|uniref:LPS export ABC transporter permease LptG n=1 Tax=Maritimibacter sp. 55A14 TaxID=2174844 RepID=UPI000D613418|nr:LPS export ABC transporter permease LptG [Maritimibacter sp. 55A14]PWE34165.1 LPS export ABC transporter permease LptG [Maritimibacter sp. 55A14]